MSILPRIKSTISSFLLGEEGKITKQSVLAIGSFLLGSATAVSIESEIVEGSVCVSCGCGGCGGGGCGGGCTVVHSNSITLDFDSVTHTEKGTHYSHSSV
jgi:hypothetical protein